MLMIRVQHAVFLSTTYVVLVAHLTLSAVLTPTPTPSPTSATTNPPQTPIRFLATTTAPSICVDYLDVIFILDESGSVTVANYEYVKLFVQDLVDDFSAQPSSDIRFAVTRYSEIVSSPVILGDEPTSTDADAFKAHINGLEKYNAVTCTAGGLVAGFGVNAGTLDANGFVQSHLTNFRFGVSTVIFLVTDGIPNSYPMTSNTCETGSCTCTREGKVSSTSAFATIKAAREPDHPNRVIALGVGSGADESFLATISDEYIHIGDFEPTTLQNVRAQVTSALRCRQGTRYPSWSPTMLPSKLPTSGPTLLPSLIPTVSPSTLVPTEIPTEVPSWTPSSNPTEIPTQVPSWTPSSNPTEFPTMLPSIGPSTQPSYSPSSEPTVKPTQVPSWTPSSNPTEIPTQVPLWTPSGNPTAVPSIVPNKVPSTRPSSPKPTTRQPTSRVVIVFDRNGSNSSATQASTTLPMEASNSNQRVVESVSGLLVLLCSPVLGLLGFIALYSRRSRRRYRQVSMWRRAVRIGRNKDKYRVARVAVTNGAT